MCLQTGALWGSIIAGAFSIGSALFFLIRWLYRRTKLSNPFEAYYESELDKIEYQYIGFASPKPQQCQIALRMKTMVKVEFVVVYFQGEGNIPTINKLYEWNIGYGEIPYNVHTHPTKDKSRYFWHYDTSLLRNNKDRIRIGIEFQANDYFNGDLIVELKTTETRKDKKLSFEIKNGQN
jgi:hypothetical protein